MLVMHRGADPGFFKRGGAHIKGLQNFGACGDRGMSEGDVPPQKRRNIAIFKVNLHDLVHSFCLGHPHKVRCHISAKNKGGMCPPLNLPLMHIEFEAWHYSKRKQGVTFTIFYPLPLGPGTTSDKMAWLNIALHFREGVYFP